MKTKKQKNVLLVGMLLLLVFFAVSIFTFHKSKVLLQDGYLASEGSAAESFAVLAAANIKLSAQQVSRLKACDYNTLMQSAENEALRSMMNQDGYKQKIKYAYVMVHLQQQEVQYSITQNNAEMFEAPIGTALDILWLLDVTVGQTATQQAEVSNELTRYSFFMEEDRTIFGQAPTYVKISSYWGNHICGYAPLYTTEGQYIGVVGIELADSDYEEYCNSAVIALGVLMCVSLFMLSMLFAFIYMQYRKTQFDKVYVDTLTHVYNRSYFNNRLCKYLNTHRHSGHFAVMIADVDWFKKVNDTYGHEVGDEVLVELGAILTGCYGKTQVVRLGGEEFVIALWYESEQALLKQLDALFESIAQHSFSSRDIKLSISLGCTMLDTDVVTSGLLSDMLRAADCMLYSAKENGRCRYITDKYDKTKQYKKG